jgi:transposase
MEDSAAALFDGSTVRQVSKFGPIVKLCDYGCYGLSMSIQKLAKQMKAKRNRSDPQCKARLALEALKDVQSVQQMAKEFEVHPVQVSDWQKKLNTWANSVFEAGKRQERNRACRVRVALAPLWIFRILIMAYKTLA